MEILLHNVHQPIGFLLPINATEAIIDCDLGGEKKCVTFDLWDNKLPSQKPAGTRF